MIRIRNLFHTNRVALLALTLTLGGTLPMPAQDTFKGANHVIELLSANEDESKKNKDDPTAILSADLKRYSEQRLAMEPAQAAGEWLKLVDRYLNLKPSSRSGSEKLTFAKLMAAVPRPEAWPELSQAIASRDMLKGKTYGREMGLLLLSHTLTSDIEARDRVTQQLDSFFKTNDVKSLGQLAYSAKSLFETIGRYGSKTTQIDEFVKELEKAEADPENSGYITLPDLVTMVGKEKATEYLKRLFVSGAELSIYDGEVTMKLALQLALENIDLLKNPLWDLVYTVNAVELYEALDKKFPRKKPAKTTGLDALTSRYDSDHSERDEARFYYLIGLILANRTEDATKLVKEIGAQAAVQQFSGWNLEEIIKAHGARPLFNYFYTLLSESPNYPYWDSCIYLAAQVGESSKMIDLTKSALRQDGLKTARKREIRSHLASAYLAADRADEAVREIRILLAAKPAAEDDEQDPAAAMMALQQQMSGGGSLGTSPAELALSLAQLGILLENSEWLEEGIKRLKAELAESPEEESYGLESQVMSASKLLVKLNRGPEAEALIIQSLSDLKKSGSGDESYRYSGSSQTANLLTTLALVYHRADRHADVLRLFDAAADWGVADLRSFIEYEKNDVPTAYIAARALAETGNQTAARRIGREYLYVDAGYDPMYQLMVELDGQKLMPLLEELYQRDQFEERPLIWKAHLLRIAGKLDEAEATVKAAIAVDPSDGEQGKDDRMRVYGVYADINQDRGLLKQEEFFRGVLRAIRMAEDADDFYAAGLYERGIRMYRESLTHFSDAYCIQSRMAIQLAELGQHEEAEKHYLKAYELMPDSFGRVESHCFGCERAFGSDRAQGLAERVFTRLAQERPDKPQVHYLLGYLREAQDRHLDALASYRKATQLDPDYLSAWKKIGTLARHMQLPQADTDDAALNILRLDPLMRHGRPPLGRVQNLAALWEAATAASQHHHALPETVYPLKASAAKLAEKKKDQNNRYRYRGNKEATGQPGDMIANHDLVKAISQFIEAARGGRNSMW